MIVIPLILLAAAPSFHLVAALPQATASEVTAINPTETIDTTVQTQTPSSSPAGGNMEMADGMEMDMDMDEDDDMETGAPCASSDVYQVLSSNVVDGTPMLLPNASCTGSSADATMNVTNMVVTGTDINITAIIQAGNYSTPVAYGTSKPVPYSGTNSTNSTTTCPQSKACGLLQIPRYLNLTGIKQSGCNGSEDPFQVHLPVLNDYTPDALVIVSYQYCAQTNDTSNTLPLCNRNGTNSSASGMMSSGAPSSIRSIKRSMPPQAIQYWGA
ncbi:MAG: hypothetical protein M1814_000070 [Vezdaea aestivalis]|nr:MAG: hypothetical protein M1814_000070 [Vezdaea aestivalis]